MLRNGLEPDEFPNWNEFLNAGISDVKHDLTMPQRFPARGIVVLIMA